MAAGLQLKFIDMAIASKRLVRNSPNLAWITQATHPIEKCHKILNFEIQDGRRAPIEIHKYFNKGTNKWTEFGAKFPRYYKTANINVKN